MTPGSSSWRATWTSSGTPLLWTRAAASWEPPIFNPVTRFNCFEGVEPFCDLLFDALVALGTSAFLPPKESSRL